MDEKKNERLSGNSSDCGCGENCACDENRACGDDACAEKTPSPADPDREIKSSEEILAEIYRNCQLALESISDILPEVEDEPLRAEIMRQHEEYEKISGRAACLARDKALELKEPNPVKKAMMWSSIKMNTLTDNSRSHIAEMLVRGTVMGITSLKTSLGEHPQNGDADISALLKELIGLEEDFEKKLKGFL